MKTVIMAGGKGTRIAKMNAEVPKPMIRIDGKPILEYQIACLRDQGLTDILLVIGYLGSCIEDYFGDGEKYGVHIDYIREEHPMGTAGALFYVKDSIKEDFLLLNGDIIFDVDISRLQKAHKNNGGWATILTHPNNHPYDSGIIIADKEGRVKQWMAKEDERGWYRNRVNAGLHMISPKLLRQWEEPVKRDLDRDVLKPLVKERKLYVYDSPEYVKDMGTPERYDEVVEDMRSGLVWKKNLSRKQRAFFLDRDGTINRYMGFLTDIKDMELLDGAADAIRMINRSGCLAVVVTNQPVIARGEVSLEELENIHNKMETLLGRQGAYVDAVFYCPHHPDRGFAGEREEYKISCSCRKPEPGMLLEAAEKYHIDLALSWMIGDSRNDVEAGRRAGCRTALVGDREGLEAAEYPDLLSCVKAILEKVKEGKNE